MNSCRGARVSVLLAGLVSAELALILVPGTALLAKTMRRDVNGTIAGTVHDAITGDPLPSANLVIVGTGLGTAADLNGAYVLRNVPVGSYTLRVSYVGYKSVETPVDVRDGVTTTKDFLLQPQTLEGEEVVVTAQARGQKEAINEQLAAKQIVNVVSSARIQELPDANAAEAVGRLPGVSILRSGGEGTKVVVRGLQPKYNAITIDGVRMASSDSANRGADLSMISPYMLEGIEVSKAVTPDQDADVIGGTVNFKLREPGSGRGGLGVNLLAQGGFTGLANAPNKYNNYKYVASTEGRFFGDAFGVLAQADLERRNLSSNELGATYDQLNSNFVDYKTLSLNLNNILRDRQRANATLVMDYRIPEGKISLLNFLSSGTTMSDNRGETFAVTTNRHLYTFNHSKGRLGVVVNSLYYEQAVAGFAVDARLSHSYSEMQRPDDWNVTFIQTSAGLNQFVNQPNLDPKAVPPAANDSLSQTILSYFTNSNDFSRERAFTASLDLERDVSFSDVVTTVLKFGGKYRYQKRSRTYEEFGNNASFSSPSARIAASLIASHFPSAAAYASSGSIPITCFADPNYNYGTFLGGDYKMGVPLNAGMMADLARLLEDNAETIYLQQPEGYARNNLASTTNNYSGHENQSAGYVMATVKVGPEISIISGIRYQHLQTTYTAPQGNQSSLSYYTYRHIDSTVTVGHGYFLPALIVRYKPLSWFDVRLSVTHTLAYPDYAAITPRIDVASNGELAWNNPRLSPSRSRNLDAYLSFYSNTIGLLTIGGFLKQIDDLIYPADFYVTGRNASPYFPPGFSDTTNFTYHVRTSVNNPYRINDWGFEFDWQTHLWYLPDPFSGLVLNINYTHVSSHARYPLTVVRRVGRVIQYVDTSYTDRLLYQPDNIINVSIGYDLGGFSARISMLYQADVFAGPTFWPQLRTTTAPYRRWDLSVKQDLPWFGLQVYCNVNNINGASDIDVIQATTRVPQSEQSYGLSAELGLRWKL